MGSGHSGEFFPRSGSNREATIQVLMDGTDANTATIALGYALGDLPFHTRRNSWLKK